MLIRRMSIDVPVNIEEVAANYCEIKLLSWPFACDALAVGLSSGRPSVFVRRNNQSPRRRRFTIAHELGHVVLPWHVGRIACTPARTAFDVESLRLIPTDGPPSPIRIGEQESEATRFASALLIPRIFIEASAETGTLGDVVESLNKANVSAIAAIIALKHNLLPGFCFLVDEDEDGYRTITSSGTNLPTRYGGGRQIAGLREKAVYAGESWLAGRRVLWFQLATQEQFTLREDPRTTSQLLRDAIARHVADNDSVRAFNRINGIVGGMLSRDRAQNEAQAMAMLSHRFEDDSEFFDIFRDSDFDLYLRRKASERIAGRSSRLSRDFLGTDEHNHLAAALGRCLT